MKASDNSLWTELRHNLVLTSEEKRVIVFVIAALLLGSGTKCYRDARSKTSVKIEQKRAISRRAYDGAAWKPD